MFKVLSTAVSKGSPFKTSNELVHGFASRHLPEFVNEMNSRKKTSLCFQRFMSIGGFYLTNVAISRPTEFYLEQNLQGSTKVCK